MDKFVVVYPSDAGGCGFYRMIAPGKAAIQNGKLVQVNTSAPSIMVDEQGAVKGINVGNAKVVVFQRPGSYQFPQVIPILQENGVKVVIDMDDSLSTIHPQNAAFKGYDPRLNHKRNWMHVARSCELADLVTVTTTALAEEYGKHGRVSVIPNHIPEAYLKVQRPLNETPVVGWAGWTSTHVDDLTVTSGMINQALVEAGGKLAAFGDEKIFRDLGVRNRPPNEHWNFTSIEHYPNKLAGFDIGLVPLRKSPFNEAKSWLKGLEYAALGIVPVVTPIGDQQKLVDLGMAIPAANPKEWYNRVKELIQDNEYRLEMSQKVREIAAEWTIEQNSDKWYDAWTT